MVKITTPQSAERKYGVLFTNHTPEHCQEVLTQSALAKHGCLAGHDVLELIQQEHSLLLDDIGIEIIANCRQRGCPHHVA